MDALWGADAGKRNKATLESHVWRLRKVLEPGRRHGESPTVLINEVGGYRLTVLSALRPVQLRRAGRLLGTSRAEFAYRPSGAGGALPAVLIGAGAAPTPDDFAR
jgi:hypothetical protein